MNRDQLHECMRRGAAAGKYEALMYADWHNGSACPMWVAALGALGTDRAGMLAEWDRWLIEEWPTLRVHAGANTGSPEVVFVAQVLGVTPGLVWSYVSAWDAKWEEEWEEEHRSGDPDESADPPPPELLTVDAALGVLDMVLAAYQVADPEWDTMPTTTADPNQVPIDLTNPEEPKP